ncbi:uncharacterized protein LOC107361447 [Tetranychus urticae]|uniref:Major facilitator superfamily (MFS) profile domain-containing protein n=1 Tax=Tetranychus urticae TaxID=32264 RepID=T1K7R4_TETUR|nr:uncharacterized protein LOC107361447 [Tetranychus urticae]
MVKSSFISKNGHLIKVLRIDIYLFLFMLGYYIGQVPTTQLIEDKICINELHIDPDLCQNLDQTTEITEVTKNDVLERTTKIKNWQTILSTIPGIAISLFSGFWIDSYPAHIRYLLMVPCVSIALQSITLMIQCIHFDSELCLTYWSFLVMGIGGSIPLVLTCAFTYIARKTPQNFRSIRFAVVELFLLTAQPAATALGAKILAMDSWFIAGNRNYVGVFLTNAIIMILATIWVYMLLNDCAEDDQDEHNVATVKSVKEITGSKANNKIESQSSKLVSNLIPANQVSYKSTSDRLSDTTTNKKSSLSIAIISEDAINNNNHLKQQIGSKEKGRQRVSIASIKPIAKSFKSIINLQNVINTFKTCLRKRENGDRAKVLNICFAIFILFISLLSESNFGFQFTEKVFHWDYRHYSNINAALLLIQAFGAILGAAFFKSFLNYQDSTLAAIATLSHFLSNLFKGMVNKESYIMGYIVYGLGGMSIPSARSTLTQIISFHEIAQVFTILSCIQAASPMVSSIFCTSIFNLTMESLPGTTYHAVAALLLYPFGVFLWINIAQRRSKEKQIKLDRNLSKGIVDLTVAAEQPDAGYVNQGFVDSSKF